MEPYVVVKLWTLITVIAGAAVVVGGAVAWHVERRFSALNTRIDDLKGEVHRRIDDLKGEVHRRIDDLKEGVKKQNEGVMSNEQRDRPPVYPSKEFERDRPHVLPTKEQKHSASTGTNPTEPRNSEPNERNR